MFWSLKRLLHRPVCRIDTMDSRRLRNARFMSYLASNNQRSLNTDRKDTVLALRRLVRAALTLGLVVFVAWVAMESAQAIGVF